VDRPPRVCRVWGDGIAHSPSASFRRGSKCGEYDIRPVEEFGEFGEQMIVDAREFSRCCDA